MKVLYIGYYKEHSDWGKIARNNILALDSAGVDVACRSIVFGIDHTPEEMRRFEEKDIEDCDVCIQHLFPDHMLPSSKFKKNIAILANEFVEAKHSTIIEKLDRFDQIWVPSAGVEIAFKDTPIEDKIKRVPYAFNKDNYKATTSAINGGIETKDKFRFYTIINNEGDGVERVLRCFHSEFDDTDNVVLLLGVDESCNKQLIDQKIEKVKTDLGLKPQASDYRKDVFVPRLSGSHEPLHIFSDCYVSCGTQRTLNLEEFDAFAFGNTPIVPNSTDAEEYFYDYECVVASIYQTNTNRSKMWPDLNNGKDYVIIPCEKEIKETMRKLYSAWSENPVIYSVNRKREAFEILEVMSLENIGNYMKENLNA